MWHSVAMASVDQVVITTVFVEPPALHGGQNRNGQAPDHHGVTGLTEQVYDASFSRRAGLVQRRRPQGRRCACRLGGRRCSQLIDHLQSRDATHCWFCERAAQYGDCVCECTACFAPGRPEVAAQHSNASVGDGTPACRREVVAQHTNASVGDSVPAFRCELCAVCSP